MDITQIMLVLSSLTTLFALVSPAITAHINNRAAYKLQSAQLFFNAKMDSYKNFLAIASSVSYPLKQDEFRNLQNAYASALVFANEEVQSAISTYLTALINCPVSPSDAELQAIIDAKAAALLAIQRDLASFK